MRQNNWYESILNQMIHDLIYDKDDMIKRRHHDLKLDIDQVGKYLEYLHVCNWTWFPNVHLPHPKHNTSLGENCKATLRPSQIQLLQITAIFGKNPIYICEME